LAYFFLLKNRKLLQSINKNSSYRRLFNGLYCQQLDISLRLLYLVSHPIQYQAPLLRLIAKQPSIELIVMFEHVDTISSYHDAGFGQTISWDVPLTDGYDNQVIKNVEHLHAEISKADALWVHGWDSGLKRGALKYAKKIGLHVLMRGENTDAAMPDGWGLKGMVKRLYLSYIFANCSGFLCVGSDNRRYYQNRGVEAARLFSMPYTVDNNFFRTRIEKASNLREEFRESLNISKNAPVILYAGKLLARKHPITLLYAFKKLNFNAENAPYLLFVGDGEERVELDQLAKDAGERVRVLDFKNQTELPAFYDLADIFVLASEKEPWGLSINEAMVGGCVPIVTEECGSAKDLIDNSTGRIVAPGDVGDLSQALDDLLANPENLAEMGANAKTRIKSWGLEESVGGLRAAIDQLSVL
jgi:glycosyltransferase involved in cell wall biosynthesis